MTISPAHIAKDLVVSACRQCYPDVKKTVRQLMIHYFPERGIWKRTPEYVRSYDVWLPIGKG